MNGRSGCAQHLVKLRFFNGMVFVRSGVGPLTAAAELGTVMGAQFHPEKSGDVGLRILRAFCAL